MPPEPPPLATDLAALARALAESQQRFDQAFYGNAAAMVIASQSDLRILDVNPRWLELFGATRDEVIGKTSVELGLIDPATARSRIGEHRQFSEGFDTELALFTRTGKPITVLASARPIRIPEGPCTLTTLIDITARKQAEEAFELAFRASPAGMVLVDASTRIVAAVNDRVLAMTRLARNELLGHRIGDVQLVVEPSWEALLAQLEREGRLMEVEAALFCKGSAPRPVLLSTEIVTLHGKVHRLTVFTDISARKAYEASLRQLNVELEQRVAARTEELELANRDLEAFTTSVSHDLRAPLRTIDGFATILLEDYAPGLPAEAQRLLTRIHQSGNHMRRLIDDLLEMARLGRHELQRSQIDLDAMVRSVVDEILAARPVADRLDLTLQPLGTIEADPTLVRAVWTNLVDNALKYTVPSGRIAVRIAREGDTFVVTDNGVGFDPSKAGQLFHAFQRMHSASEFEGTGIGLANVRAIVERHHGKVWADSEPGRGSTFSFTLGGA